MYLTDRAAPARGEADGRAVRGRAPVIAPVVLALGAVSLVAAPTPAPAPKRVDLREAARLMRLPRLRALTACAVLLGLTTVSDAFVFKKRVLNGASLWHEYVLDLRTLKQTPPAEHRSVDDQAT